jgi:branched-chain amino acid transport system permease protein
MPDFTPFLVSGLALAATYVLSAVGIVVLYRASGVVNFAQGAVGALAAFISWSIVERGGPEALSWIVGVAAAAVISLAYGRLIATRLVSSDPITRAVATLSFALILLGFMGYLWGEAWCSRHVDARDCLRSRGPSDGCRHVASRAQPDGSADARARQQS